ncbi:Hypothetical protein R9X50_00410500 [Acrodontium crateriforme]|uniref:Osmotin, thaumatin-like protein n=1 Tax=Acrodontium crateriforme TaxID=150365 RepID=A0AAQ3M5G3_9PEZI|nr:Hypothetical protein R9X50_00410500 [Acrodontium crateriforme]
MLSIKKLALAAIMATVISARPFQQKRDDSYFTLTVINSCSYDQSVGIYKINTDYTTTEIMSMTNIPSGTTSNFSAPYYEVGLRLATNQDQFLAQDLFEFGYSQYTPAGGSTIEGTAYDISMFAGTTEGMRATPANTNCPTKTCTSSSCAKDQAWTDANDYELGSPADTTCYYGKTDFTVEFCPQV